MAKKGKTKRRGLPRWGGKWPLGSVTLLSGGGPSSIAFDFHVAHRFSGAICLSQEKARQFAAMILDTGGEINKYWTDESNPFGDPGISKGLREP
jgi:hypothetical protein